MFSLYLTQFRLISVTHFTHFQLLWFTSLLCSSPVMFAHHNLNIICRPNVQFISSGPSGTLLEPLPAQDIIISEYLLFKSFIANSYVLVFLYRLSFSQFFWLIL